MRQSYVFPLIVIVIAIAACCTDLNNAEGSLEIANLDTNQDRVLTNEETAYRSLRENIMPENASGNVQIEERSWLTNFNSVFGKSSSTVKSLETNPALGQVNQVLQKNPTLSKQVEVLQKDTKLIDSLSKNPSIVKLGEQAAKHPSQLTQKNIINLGKAAAKTTTRGAAEHELKFWYIVGAVILAVLFSVSIGVGMGVKR